MGGWAGGEGENRGAAGWVGGCWRAVRASAWRRRSLATVSGCCRPPSCCGPWRQRGLPRPQLSAKTARNSATPGVLRNSLCSNRLVLPAHPEDHDVCTDKESGERETMQDRTAQPLFYRRGASSRPFGSIQASERAMMAAILVCKHSGKQQPGAGRSTKQAVCCANRTTTHLCGTGGEGR